MDPIGWFIATTHQLLGHDKTAAITGNPEDAGRQAECVICQYEADPTPERKAAVEAALSPPPKEVVLDA